MSAMQKWRALCVENNVAELGNKFCADPPHPTLGDERARIIESRGARAASWTAGRALAKQLPGTPRLTLCVECHDKVVLEGATRAWTACRNTLAGFRHDAPDWDVVTFTIGSFVSFHPWQDGELRRLARTPVVGTVTAFDEPSGFFTIKVGDKEHEAFLQHKSHHAVVVSGAQRAAGRAAGRAMLFARSGCGSACALCTRGAPCGRK